MQKHLLEIQSNKEIANKIFETKLSGDFDLEDFQPGKFLHIKTSDSIHPLLRRPMSICDINNDGNLMTILYRSEGEGTKLMSQKHPGDLLNLLAPLGKSFNLKQTQPGDTVYLVGGGIGVPPLYYLGRKLKQKGAIIKSFLGFNSAPDVFYQAEVSQLGECQVATVDGSSGHKGFVTDLVDQSFNILYSCGPVAMFSALQKSIPQNKNAYISMEERMGCGVGACLACVCKPSKTYHSDTDYMRACTEGPVFKLHDIDLVTV